MWTVEAPAPEMLPVFLELSGRRVLVVGGGSVAAAKVAALQPTGALVTVVAPAIDRGIIAAGATVHRRRVRDADLSGAWFVIAAATPDVNRRVARAARTRRIFVNAVDDPPNASAYLGGVLRRDGVTIAISTSGRAPALAGLLREAFDALLPRDLAAWLAESDRLRASWRRRRTSMPLRRPALARAILRLYRRRPAGPVS
jgi:uroporphyrin-III C-methyltransferase/precorrin-2 dehydrogenase/sirohydrochlorin ferrochelatase